MERAQARMLLQEYIPRSSEVVLVTEISQTAQVGVALPENSPGPPFSRRPEHPPTGTLWAPDMHSSRSTLHACSSPGQAAGKPEVENGIRDKPI